MSYQRYKINGKKTESEDIDIELLYITQADYEVDWQSVMHTHHFTELFYVVSGEGIMVVEQEKFTLSPGQLVIINPLVSHVEYGDGVHRLEYIVIGIDGLKFHSADNTSYNYCVHNLYSCRDEIMDYCTKLLREVRNEQEHYDTICQKLLECLILFLMRQTQDLPTYTTEKKTLRECRFIEQYIEEHFSEDITLEILSQMTHMSKYYLAHKFREYKGISPISYLNERRIHEASNLLETSDYSVGKIACAVGFSSQSYFAQAFKERKGISPMEYRKAAAT